MKETLKIAIIGCGGIAKAAHIPAYLKSPGAEIKYFCDFNLALAEELVKEHGCGTAVQNYKDILDDPDLDAVSVCTPNHVHASVSIEFLKAGKHVLCEKPAARTYEEALEMQKVAQETGKILLIGVVNRFNTAVNIIKNMIEDGELGELYHIYASFRAHRSIPGLGGAFTTRAISGGGVMIDWGIHYLDIVMYCSGDPKPKTVTAQAYSKLGRDMKEYAYMNMWAGPPKFEGTYDVDDFVTALIRTEGPTISMNGSWAQNIGEEEMYIDFLGDKAGIRLNYGGDFKLFGAKNGALMESTPKFNKQDQFQSEIDAFLNSIRTGEKLPSHIDTVIVSAKMIQAIYDSSEQGKEISFTS
ncbi:Gfo/Idh/MocA family protein [Paenibacillus lemnae]|uniref:Gfo/Idh/MocA family oxidoreductase n=1 Tax=Paenibacillus lemnae TaxID=1330551 RepID=A0A848M8F0_PAELE|nr:Gfo/Idh/MocA family oxidoreductase [Paenibacillus lemnae]NMO96549.1 Gfo/Idh/MocA family oxidoreductase [Paenibacillus lemnae]